MLIKINFNLVVGVSGGIDSAVTSALCAKTNIKNNCCINAYKTK